MNRISNKNLSLITYDHQGQNSNSSFLHFFVWQLEVPHFWPFYFGTGQPSYHMHWVLVHFSRKFFQWPQRNGCSSINFWGTDLLQVSIESSVLELSNGIWTNFVRQTVDELYASKETVSFLNHLSKRVRRYEKYRSRLDMQLSTDRSPSTEISHYNRSMTSLSKFGRQKTQSVKAHSKKETISLEAYNSSTFGRTNFVHIPLESSRTELSIDRWTKSVLKKLKELQPFF